VALPDFLIVGAMKCGTSTLAAQLGAQAGVFMTTPKEPEFFSEDAQFARGRDWYEGLFAAAPPGDVLGEASTGYTKLPTHPEVVARVAALLPAPKLIYLIRDPLERLVSHYIHEWTMGVMGGTLTDSLAAHPELVAYGCYGMQIAPWAETFGRERILLLSLEEMQAAPQPVLERVAAFIGAPGRPVWAEEHARANASAERFRRLPLHGLLIDNPVATALRRRLVPQALRDRLKRARQMPDRPALTAAERARLTGVFAEDRARLASLFPGHPALEQSYPFLAERA
jgi:hypothetical protein